jgi:hypothetical protein
MQQSEDIQLNPVIEPIPVEFTMDTIGWKILFFLIFIAVLYGVYKFFVHYKNNQYRRDAIARIQAIDTDSGISVPEFINRIMFQIKQTALHTFGRKKVASLDGEQWLEFLDNSAKNTNFDQYHDVILRAVYKEEYSQNSNFNKKVFINSTIKWIKHHAR